MSTMDLAELTALTAEQLDQAARILREAFMHLPSSFADEANAQAEVKSFLADPERSALAALEGAEVRGWIGWIKAYSHGWELHPLAVDPRHQRRGIGTRLVEALEHRAQAAGILTLWLGSDDEFGGTNLYGADVFPNVLHHAARVAQTTDEHPLTFYRKLGFEVVGLMPDVNGFGKPDILMAKRVRESR